MTAQELAQVLVATSNYGRREKPYVSVRVELERIALVGFQDGCTCQKIMEFEAVIGHYDPCSVLYELVNEIRASIRTAIAV